MAKKESRFKNTKVINSALKTINSLMDSIYRNTYNSDRNSMNSVDTVTKDLEDTIASIMSKNNMSDINNVSRLFSKTKLSNLSNDKQFTDSVNALFDDPSISANILSMYTENRWIRDLDHEYDMILKYMPKLQEALNAKKENVLSSDNFSKDFLNETSKNLSDPTAQALFTTRIENLKRKYKLQTFYEETYDRVSKYGEEFVYCVPYSKAISDLLKNKGRTRIGISQSSRGDYSGVAEVSVIENGVILDKNLYDKVDAAMKVKDSNIKIPDNFKIIFDNRGILESAYREHTNIINGLNTTPKSIYEAVLEAGNKETIKMDTTVPDKLEVPKNFDKNERTTSTDGFVSLNGDKDTNVKVPGSVLKRLKHENIIPIYIDQVCLGYYYIEFLGGNSYDKMADTEHMYSRNNIMTGIMGRDRNFSSEAIADQRNKLLSYFAGSIANNINASFVNNNQDLNTMTYLIVSL